MSFADIFKCLEYIFFPSLPFSCCNKNLTFITETIPPFDFPLNEKRGAKRNSRNVIHRDIKQKSL